jgi:hypothetical protein
MGYAVFGSVWLCFVAAPKHGNIYKVINNRYLHSISSPQIGFVFSTSLTAESAKTAENKEYIQKLCDLGAPGGEI